MPDENVLTLENLNQDELALLISGLTSLEGALNALERPLPTNINKLKNCLIQRIEALNKLKRKTMTTNEVATLLNCTPRTILNLGKKRKIELAKSGSRKRGDQNLYYTDSVDAYRQKLDCSALLNSGD